MNPLKELLINMINPLKNWIYLDDYYKRMIKYDLITRCYRRIINCCFLVIIIRHLYLSFFTITNETRIMLFDIFYLYELPIIVNFLFSIMLICLFIIENDTYLNTDIFNIIREVLFKSNSNYIQLSVLDSNTTMPIKYIQFIQEWTKILFKIRQISLFLINICFLVWQFKILLLLNEYSGYFFQPIWLMDLLKIITIEFNMFLCAIDFNLLANTTFLLGITILIFTLIILIKFHLLHLFLNQNRTYSTMEIKNIIKDHNNIFQMVCQFNRSYRKIIIWYLIGNMPYNIYRPFYFILNHNINLFQQLGAYIMVIQQFIGIFGFHLLFSSFPMKIHGLTIKRLISINVRQQFTMFGFHLKLTNYILKFHIKNRYGMHYNKIHLLHLQAFFKVYFNLSISLYHY